LDLKVWVTMKLLEDPGRDAAELIRDFTDGYYGAAGEAVRRYLDLLSESFRSQPSHVSNSPDPSGFRHLNVAFFRASSRILDEAATAVRGNRDLERRVRHLELPIDRALLFRWFDLEDEVQEADAEEGRTGGRVPFSRSEVLERCRSVWREQTRFRSYRKGLDAVALGDAEPDCGWDLPPERSNR